MAQPPCSSHSRIAPASCSTEIPSPAASGSRMAVGPRALVPVSASVEGRGLMSANIGPHEQAVVIALWYLDPPEQERGHH